MGKKILMITGSPRKAGNSNTLAAAFAAGATSAGHEVRVIDAACLEIGGCHADGKCLQSGRCGLKDDGVKIYEGMEWADVLVLVSPVYWASFTTQMKVVLDRLYPYVGEPARKKCHIRKSYLISTANQKTGDMFDGILKSYDLLTDLLGFERGGEVLVPGLGGPSDIQNREDMVKKAADMGMRV